MDNIPFEKSSDWSSLVINQVVDDYGSLLGYILVMNPDRPNPKWKLAGGHKKRGETPLQTAMRENQEETGLRIPEDEFTEIVAGLEWRPRPKGHWSFLFSAKVPEQSIRLLHDQNIGNGGEIARYFTLDEFADEIRHGTILLPHVTKMRLVEEQLL